jgi:fructose-1,6-bisphosphatase/inositol monophosphatase family enzyme
MTISDADSRAMLDLARRAATEAGSMVIQTPAHTLRASTTSSPADFVTEMDRAAEQLILETILAARPDDGMVGEEGASKASQSGRTHQAHLLRAVLPARMFRALSATGRTVTRY